MKITSINIKPVSDSERLAARVSLTIDNAISIRGLRLWRGKNDGKFTLSIPIRRRRDEVTSFCDPLTDECRQYLTDAVISAYQAALAEPAGEDSYIFDMDAMEPGEAINVTGVTVTLNERKDSRVKAFAEIVIDDVLKLSSMVIVERENKPPLLGMPNFRRHKREDGTLSDLTNVYHPISAEERQRLTDIVMTEYEKVMAAAE